MKERKSWEEKADIVGHSGGCMYLEHILLPLLNTYKALFNSHVSNMSTDIIKVITCTSSLVVRGKNPVLAIPTIQVVHKF